MRTIPAINVTSPQDCVSNINVIFDGGAGNHPFSVVRLDWEGYPCVAMRWNVGRREWDEPEKINNSKVCLGMPVSRGFAVWFILPDVMVGKDSDIWKLIEKLKKESSN